MERWNGYKFDKNTFVNRVKSINPLAKLSYKELQKVAFRLHLPANLQHKVLLAEIIAKKTGRDDIVNIIVKTSRQKKREMSSSESGFGTMQQLTSITSFNVLPDANNLVACNVVPESLESRNDNIASETLVDPISSTLITNDVFFTNNSFTNVCNDNEYYVHENVEDCSSCPDVNFDQMLVPTANKIDNNKGSTDVVGISDNNLQFRTPSCSFDSGMASFTSADSGFEDINLQEFLNGSQLGSILIQVEDEPKISLVEVLKTLSDN